MLRLSLALTGGLLCVALAGCGSKGPTLYPVTGKVVAADGKPVANASVVFHPTGAADPSAAKPRGKTDADGKFSLTTATTDDGAPSGEYRVTVEQWLAGPKSDDPPANRLPAAYATPDKSGLTATVGTGPTELQPFVIKR
jgi:predicted small lipoprotein YifL